MKKSLFGLFVFCLLLLSATTLAQVTNMTHGGTGPYTTIQAAIDNVATVNNDIITVNGDTYTAKEAIVVTKEITIKSASSTAPTITPPASAIGITVSANNVILQNLIVTGTTGSLSTHGIWANGVSHLTIQNVTVTNNAGSGIALRGVGTTSSLTGVTATGNKNHGLEIGNGCNGVKVDGGTFTGNGTFNNLSTGGGIMIYADAGKTTLGTTIQGVVDVSTNTTAGIYLFCNPGGNINNTTIGVSGTGSITSNNNGSTSTSSYGTGGAAVLVYGPCDQTTITNVNSTVGSVNPTAGLVVLGTDASGTKSPTSTVVKGCTLSGFTTTSPAATMYAHHGSDTYICTNDVDASSSDNEINGYTPAQGFEVENVLYHKIDDATLGRFLGPGTAVYVPTGGIINNGIEFTAGTSYTTVNVQDGTYAQNVVVDQAITLNGQGATTIINPSSGNGVAVTASSGVTVKNLKIYLSSPVSVVGSPTFTTNTFVFKQPIKVYLQGAWRGTAMGIELEDPAGDHSVIGIPQNQPYNVVPWNYTTGTETVNTSSYPMNMVDWILVDLRTGTAGSTKIARRAAVLLSNGSVKDVDGISDPQFTCTMNGIPSYYIVIQHRNHLAVMSAGKVNINTAYDFTTGLDKYYTDITVGNDPAVNLGSSRYAMFAGDYSEDAFVDVSDFNGTVNDYYNTGYYLSDLTMDGFVDVSDYNPVVNNYYAGTNVPDADHK